MDAVLEVSISELATGEAPSTSVEATRPADVNDFGLEAHLTFVPIP